MAQLYIWDRPLGAYEMHVLQSGFDQVRYVYVTRVRRFDQVRCIYVIRVRRFDQVRYVYGRTLACV